VRGLWDIFIVIIHLCLFSTFSFAGFNFSGPSSAIEFGQGTNFVLRNALSTSGGTVSRDSGATISGQSITFDYGIFDDAGNETLFSGVVAPSADNEVSLNGNQVFRLKKGKVQGVVKISGLQNRIEGDSFFSNSVILQDNNSSLTYGASGRFPTDITLNGGSLFLENDLQFLDNKSITGSGRVNVNGRRLSFGAKDLTFSQALYFDHAADIDLNSNLHLNTTWTFGGISVLNGNGNALYLDTGGNIVIDYGSTLLLKDIIIKKVAGNNIKCMDNSATLSVKNIKWIFDDNYSFTLGHFDVMDDWELCGNYIFAYQSCVTSTLWSNSSIILDSGFTFSYDPPNTRKDLVCFEDDSAILYLDSATLYATVTGMQLTKGKLLVDGHSYLACEVVTSTWGNDEGKILVDQGITFGNNSSSDDFRCKILGGAKLEFTSGSLLYKNTQATFWEMINSTSILEINTLTKLKLYQTLNLSLGQIILQGGSEVWNVADAQLLGSVNTTGAVISVQID
jgi:hypothetical protein